MTKEQKDWIDNASYYDLMKKWRFEPLGSKYFQDTETSDYFSKKMNEEKQKCDHVAVSKRLGW